MCSLPTNRGVPSLVSWHRWHRCYRFTVETCTVTCTNTTVQYRWRTLTTMRREKKINVTGMVTGHGVETGQFVGRPDFLPWPSPGLLVLHL